MGSASLCVVERQHMCELAQGRMVVVPIRARERWIPVALPPPTTPAPTFSGQISVPQKAAVMRSIRLMYGRTKAAPASRSPAFRNSSCELRFMSNLPGSTRVCGMPVSENWIGKTGGLCGTREANPLILVVPCFSLRHRMNNAFRKFVSCRSVMSIFQQQHLRSETSIRRDRPFPLN